MRGIAIILAIYLMLIAISVYTGCSLSTQGAEMDSAGWGGWTDVLPPVQHIQPDPETGRQTT